MVQWTDNDLLRRLLSPEARDRQLAAATIGKLRRYDLLPDLIDLMHNDESREVRGMAAWALDLIGSPETVPALLDALYDSDFGVRSNAGWALVHLAQRFVPELLLGEVIEIIQDHETPSAQEMAYLILIRIHHIEARQAAERYRKRR